MQDFSDWVGRQQSAEDIITPRQVRQMAATLGGCPGDGMEAGDPLPPLWHWMGWGDETPMAGLGVDGHPDRGGFLPPVPLPRRMWAGGRLAFHAPIPIGAPLRRLSQILSVTAKTGASGPLVFVTVRHDISAKGRSVLTEEHDIAYVSLPKAYVPPQPQAAPPDPLWAGAEACDPVRLFRYSALTFNGHRIHYDLAHATGAEGYPGLVVHGPLQATLLMQAARRHAGGAQPMGFAFRALRAIFHQDAMQVQGWPAVAGRQQLATVTADGLMCMSAEVVWTAAG